MTIDISQGVSGLPLDQLNKAVRQSIVGIQSRLQQDTMLRRLIIRQEYMSAPMQQKVVHRGLVDLLLFDIFLFLLRLVRLSEQSIHALSKILLDDMGSSDNDCWSHGSSVVVSMVRLSSKLHNLNQFVQQG